MALYIGGQNYTTAQLAQQMQAVFNLACLEYCLPDEPLFCQALADKDFLTEKVNFITTGEYAFVDPAQAKPYIASLGTTSCLQFSIFNPTTKELLHCHYNSAFTIAWLDIMQLFSGQANLQLIILGGNTFLNREGSQHNISMLNLAALIESLAYFLKCHRYTINICSQMVMHHNSIWVPMADYRATPLKLSPTLPGMHQQRMLQLQKNIGYQGVIPAELMKDVVVEFPHDKNCPIYYASFPLALQEDDYINVARTAREWAAYLRQYEGEKLPLLAIYNKRPLLDVLLKAACLPADVATLLKIPHALINQYLERYDSIFSGWDQADSKQQIAMVRQLKSNFVKFSSRYRQWKFLKELSRL